MMTKRSQNPWERMTNGTKRRVEFDTKHDFFWITSYEGQYGFYIKLIISSSKKAKFDICLRGIEIVSKTRDEFIELFFILEKNADWEIFYVLCRDLISTIDTYEEDSERLFQLINRLKRWQHLLLNKEQLGMPVEKQMGLFSELYCLINVIAPYKGYCVAIDSWVGPYKDKQDFILEKTAVEVKSHRVSKGNYANISSVDQLVTEKEKLYIISYGLTISETGYSIDDLYNKIIDELSKNNIESLKMKLFEAGWILNYDGHRKERFLIDSQTIYFVGDNFPKVKRSGLDYRIKDLRYKIDLSQCQEYVININDFCGGE